MEGSPNSQFPEAKSNDNAEKKKKSDKKRGRFYAPLPIELDAADKSNENVEQNKASSPLDEALANLVRNKNEHDEQTPEPEDTETESNETPEEAPESTDEPIESDHELDINQAEVLPDRKIELPLNEFSGGEVVIQLQQPIQERADMGHGEIPSLPIESIPTANAVPTDSSEGAPAANEIPEIADTHQVSNDAETPLTPPAEAVATVTTANSETPQYVPVEILQSNETIQSQPWQSPNAAPAVPVPHGAEQVATKQDVENAVYRATREGQNRGVLAGLLVGGGIEHFKHRRREKRLRRVVNQQSKELKRSEQDTHFALQEQDKQTTIQTYERAQQEKQQQRRFAKTEAQSRRFENKTTQKFERLLPKRPEQKKLENPEELTIPADHRIESSSWHSIEVDAKTGKPVENPTFQYGHEYYRERAQEAGPKDQFNAAAGEVALVAAAMSSSNDSHNTDPSQQDAGPSKLPSSASSKSAPAQQAKEAMQKVQSSLQSNGPVWPLVVVLIAVIICVIIALR